MDIIAFQYDAYQSGAFQSEVMAESAFQACTFQLDAFQTEECNAPIVVPTGGSGKGKKPVSRVYIKRDDRILVFANERQAQAYVEAEKAIEEAKKPKQYPKKKKKTKEKIEQVETVTQPEEVITLDYVRIILEQYSIPLPSVDKYEINALMAIYNHALHINEINSINRELEDEDDIEVLLLMEA